MFLGRTIMQPLLLDLRVHLRVPEDRPGRSAAIRRDFSTLLVGRRDRERDDLPGSAGGRAAARAGLRLHPRDRRPRARADAGVGRRRREGRRRARSRRCSRRSSCSRSRAFIPADAGAPHVHWFYLLTLLPLAAVMSASLGLTIGTRVQPRQVPLIFSLLVIPMTFLGAVYYPWKNLTPLPWLKIDRARQPARLHERRACASRSPTACRTCPRSRSTSRSIGFTVRVPEARHRRLQEARPELTERTELVAEGSGPLARASFTATSASRSWSIHSPS